MFNSLEPDKSSDVIEIKQQISDILNGNDNEPLFLYDFIV